MMRGLVPGVACVALLIGCGDDGSSMDSNTGMSEGSEGSTSATSQGGGPSSGPSTNPGTETDDPQSTTDDPTTGLDGTSSDSTGPGVMPCEYPGGAVEPMTLDEVLFPYSWPEALHADGRQVMLDLADAPCGYDEVIEWSPHDVLLFVSVPAW